MASFLKCGLARGLARVLIAALVASSLPVPARASYYTRLDTRIAKDELGNRLFQTDANGHTTHFLYDKLGRQSARILPDGKRELMAYDPAGNLETRTDFMGRQTSYGYDENNRLLSRSYPSAAESVSFTYTPTGRRLTATDARGTTSYGYDVRDRLLSLTQPGFGPGTASLGYTYDGNGNRLTLTATVNGQSHTTGYTYDDAGRLDLVTDPAGRVYDHGYDRNSNRESLAHPNGVATAYTYDNLNRLTNLATTHPASTRHIQSYRFTLGPAGNRTKIVEHQGLPQQRTLDYSYDSLYRLTGETATESLGLAYSKTFGYDPVGNRQTQTTTIGPAGSPGPTLQPGTIGYGYDTRDRLLSEQLDATPATAYGWDSNGNLTTKDAEATYTWDHENRLLRVQKTDGTVVEHAYDADGNRVQTKTTPPAATAQTTNFLVDTSASLSHVVAEAHGTGMLQALYVRGDDLLSVMRPLAAAPASATDWQTRHYHADGIGSIRRLTDEAGNITDGYTYSAFGELLAHTGADPQPYAFTGELLDPNSGFQYHRARWMDPSTGRFTGMDPFAGMEWDPRSLVKYLYAAGDPVNLRDASGLIFSPLQWATIGCAVHGAVSQYYAALGGIIDSAVCWSNRKRPDIRFHRDAVGFPGTQGEVYEIKPFADAATAAAEVQWYSGHLKSSHPQVDWKPGTMIAPQPSFYPFGQFIHPLLTGYSVSVRLSGLGDGVIVYTVGNSLVSKVLPVLVLATVTGALLINTVGVVSLSRF